SAPRVVIRCQSKVSATILRSRAARLAYRAPHMACARLQRPPRPITGQRSRSSERSSDGAEVAWLRSTPAQPTAAALHRRLCTSSEERKANFYCLTLGPDCRTLEKRSAKTRVKFDHEGGPFLTDRANSARNSHAGRRAGRVPPFSPAGSRGGLPAGGG